MHREIIMKVLSRVPVFKDLPEEAVTRLAYMARLNQYPEDTTVFREGDPGDCLYIVASGKVEIYARNEGGDDIKLNTLGVSDVFGEMALLDGLPRSATVKVIQKALLFYISRTDFCLFLSQSPEVAMNIIETISRRLRETNRKIRELSSENDALKVMIREGIGSTGETALPESPGDDFLLAGYTCPCCGMTFQSLKLRDDRQPVKTDSDSCPYYEGENPLFYEVVICPDCRYPFGESFSGRLGPGVKNQVRDTLEKADRPSECAGRRGPDEALEYFTYAFRIHEEIRINSWARADLSLKLAWLYRYREDQENERKHLLLALERLVGTYEEVKYENPQRDLHLMYMIGQAHLKTGDTAEALKWFVRIAQHPYGDQSPQIVEKARGQWQELRGTAGRKK